MTICTFAGHREVYQIGIEAQFNLEIEKLLQTDNEFQFLTGGMGQFDDLGAKIIRAAKHRHPEKSITLVMVLSYMSNRLNNDKEYYQFCYDNIILPDELSNVYYKAAIQLRNRWMIDQADIVISYIHRNFGGAFATVRYAQKQGKTIVNPAKNKDSV